MRKIIAGLGLVALLGTAVACGKSERDYYCHKFELEWNKPEKGYVELCLYDGKPTRNDMPGWTRTDKRDDNLRLTNLKLWRDLDFDGTADVEFGFRYDKPKEK